MYLKSRIDFLRQFGQEGHFFVVVQLPYDTVLTTEVMQRLARYGRMILSDEQGYFVVA
jgi:hypothetical protein